ncbi:hypothetical protein [Formosa sp. A9]|uniref:hypothetical protein n=1 Tax=Formosa sp. A9 TaxID=3442641 RepID=UPI003EBB26BC
MSSILKTIDFFQFLKVRYAGNIPYQNILIVGLILGWFTYLGLERNWIPIKLIISITIIVSAIITFWFKKFYKNNLGFYWSFFHNIGIGLIFAFLFLKSNDLLSSKPIVYNNYRITDVRFVHGITSRGSRTSPMKPIISIDFKGTNKNFTLSPVDSKNITIRNAYMGVKEGFWNYDVIKSIDIARKQK